MAVSIVGMDNALPERVYRASLAWSAVVGLALGLAGVWSVTWGFLIGAGISILFFKIFWWTVDRALKRSDRRAGLFALEVYVVKFPLLGVFLYYLFTNVEVEPFALVGGVATVPAMMLAMAIRVALGRGVGETAGAKAPGGRTSFQGQSGKGGFW